MAADPTYPLFPVFGLLSAALLLTLLTTNLVRHSWNLGVTFLCFWLFWGNLFTAINSIIWADNVNLKLYVYCDIVSHLYIFTGTLKPACTLIITRRLYKIASQRSLVADSRRIKATNAFVEWSVGLGLPALVTGVFYYIVQGSRFEIAEGMGCGDAPNPSGVEILLVQFPGILLPLISVVFYCPKIVYVFYRYSRDTNQFLQTDGSVSRSGYSRILALGCLDIVLSIPFGIIQVISEIHDFVPGATFECHKSHRIQVNSSYNGTLPLALRRLFELDRQIPLSFIELRIGILSPAMGPIRAAVTTINGKSAFTIL